MSNGDMPLDATISVNGREYKATSGTTLLSFLRTQHIDVPSLCYHPELESIGACRVCTVQVTPPGSQWPRLVASCVYPVKDALQVETHNDEVQKARRFVLGLLLARHPEAKRIQQLAKVYGADTDLFSFNSAVDNCLLCGLCTRVCETYATQAISTSQRGVHKQVATFAERASETCVGCGACAIICPTQHIQTKRDVQGYHIWQKKFPIASCKVDENQCLSCGTCESTCPFSVIRTAFLQGQIPKARVPIEYCRGCGACVASCPVGAIDQNQYSNGALESRISKMEWPKRSTLRTTVFCCERTGMSDKTLAENIQFITMPCVGRISANLLLYTLAHGANTIVVLGRHQSSCRLNGAEDKAREQVQVTQALLGNLYADSKRVQFVNCLPGSAGPRKTIQKIMPVLEKTLSPASYIPLVRKVKIESGFSSLHLMLDDLIARSPTEHLGKMWLKENEIDNTWGAQTVLYIGFLPFAALSMAKIIKPTHITEIIRAALRLMKQSGFDEISVQPGGFRELSDNLVTDLKSKDVYVLSSHDTVLLARYGIRTHPLSVTYSTNLSQLKPCSTNIRIMTEPYNSYFEHWADINIEVIDRITDPCAQEGLISQQQLTAAIQYQQLAHQQQAHLIVTDHAWSFINWALLLRHGAWQTTNLIPVMTHQLIEFAWRKGEIDFQTLRQELFPLGRTNMRVV